MSIKPLPPVRGMSGGGFMIDSDDGAHLGSSEPDSTAIENDALRRMWTETQWTSLSKQAVDLGLPKLPYFDTKTMLLSKDVNKKLWQQLLRLYKVLGPDQAPFASPKMFEGGEVKWYNWGGNAKGVEVEIYAR